MAPWSRASAKSGLVLALAAAWSLLGSPSLAGSFDLKGEVMRCEGCHGANGRADVMPNNGRIAGQNEAYLLYILRQYRAGQLGGVNAGIMSYSVRQLSDEDLRALAHYYAAAGVAP